MNLYPVYQTVLCSVLQTVNELEEEHSRRRGRKRGRGKKRQDPRGAAEKASEPITVTYDPSTPNSMQWTKKYAPQSAADIVGNAEVVQRLRQWLEEWSARRKKASKSRRRAGAVKRGNSNRSNASSSNSFVVSDDDDYDDETSSDDGGDDEFSDGSLDGEEDFPPNTALLSGPTGVGKTATVHALARQLGFKVLEVNASSLRGGRQVTAQLQEATQSHHVKNKKLPFEAALAPSAVGAKDVATKSRRGVSGGGGGSHLNKTALILFEDVDVVFEEDEGFYAAINSLVSTTKRPVILTTSNGLFSARKFLKCDPKSFVFSPVPPSLTARHLRLLGLCEGFALDVRGLERLVEFNGGGAVSRSILDLQYWTTTSSSSSSSSPALTSEKRGTGAETTLHGGNKIGLEHPKRGERESSTSNAERNTGDGDGGREKGKEEASQGDPLAKLMSVNEREALQEVSSSSDDEMRFYGDAVANAFSAGENGGRLFGDLERVQDLWLNGFAELYEMNKDAIIPFPRRDGARPGRKQVYPLAAESESEAEGGGRLKNRAFLADSESDTDDAKSEQEQVKSESEPRAKTGSIPRTETEKAAFMRAKAAIAQLGECADISSMFVRAADVPQWWTKQAAAAEREYDQLGLEIGATAQFLAVSAARKAAIELTENASEAEAASLCIDGIDIEKEFVVKRNGSAATDRRSRGGVCSEVLNSVLEMTVNPQPQVLDVMPALRRMARTEEMRRAGKGGGKRSRSGRFLHYFEAQEIYLKPATVIEMCNTFL